MVSNFNHQDLCSFSQSLIDGVNPPKNIMNLVEFIKKSVSQAFLILKWSCIICPIDAKKWGGTEMGGIPPNKQKKMQRLFGPRRIRIQKRMNLNLSPVVCFTQSSKNQGWSMDLHDRKYRNISCPPNVSSQRGQSERYSEQRLTKAILIQRAIEIPDLSKLVQKLGM